MNVPFVPHGLESTVCKVPDQAIENRPDTLHLNELCGVSACVFCFQTNTLRPELLSFHNCVCQIPLRHFSCLMWDIFSQRHDSHVDVGNRRRRKTLPIGRHPGVLPVCHWSL